MNIYQTSFFCINDLVPEDHIYRKFLQIVDFNSLLEPLDELIHQGSPGAIGYGVGRLFKAALLQFMEDLSDRQMERFLRENLAAKLFCDFGLGDKTPDHSVFGDFRKRGGASRLSKVFKALKTQLKDKGYMREIFTFVDATHLITKANLWKERDKAIQQKYEKLNNEALPKVAHDKEARIGCKGKNKFWYGYKKHNSVDMQSGLIDRVAVTPANVTDAQGFRHSCPRKGAVFGDKGFCIRPATREMQRRGIHNATIKNNNMRGKDFDKDRWLTQVRMPYERIFSKSNKRARYMGVVKNQCSGFMEALAHNFKRLTVLEQATA